VLNNFGLRHLKARIRGPLSPDDDCSVNALWLTLRSNLVHGLNVLILDEYRDFSLS